MTAGGELSACSTSEEEPCLASAEMKGAPTTLGPGLLVESPVSEDDLLPQLPFGRSGVSPGPGRDKPQGASSRHPIPKSRALRRLPTGDCRTPPHQMPNPEHHKRANHASDDARRLEV